MTKAISKPLIVALIAAVTGAGVALAASRPLAIQEGGIALHGTLDVPAGPGPSPVVLIIPGSGPTNADGNSVMPPGAPSLIQHSPYLQIAQGLSAAGFAVARMNKRDLPPSSHLATSVDDYVLDAQQTLAALRKDATIDPRRIVVLGHSEGGLVALKVANQERLHGLILTGTAARPLRDVITDQVLTLNRQRGATEEQLSALRKVQDGFYQALRDYVGTGPLAYAGHTYPEATAKLLKSEIDVDPLELARQITIPTLILQGGQDLNVAPDNGNLIAAALRRGHLVFIQDMSHVLTVASARTPDQLHTTPQTKVHPRVIPALVQWLGTNIRG
jgi:pimeloyl-ACP methyl ester carboxylesterase